MAAPSVYGRFLRTFVLGWPSPVFEFEFRQDAPDRNGHLAASSRFKWPTSSRHVRSRLPFTYSSGNLRTRQREPLQILWTDGRIPKKR